MKPHIRRPYNFVRPGAWFVTRHRRTNIGIDCDTLSKAFDVAQRWWVEQMPPPQAEVELLYCQQWESSHDNQ